MSMTTRIGALTLLLSLVVARFADGWIGAGAAAAGAALLVVGLLRDRRARRAASAGPVRNWAEDFTARVRRERFVAATAARSAATTSDDTATPDGADLPADGVVLADGAVLADSAVPVAPTQTGGHESARREPTNRGPTNRGPTTRGDAPVGETVA